MLGGTSHFSLLGGTSSILISFSLGPRAGPVKTRPSSPWHVGPLGALTIGLSTQFSFQYQLSPFEPYFYARLSVVPSQVVGLQGRRGSRGRPTGSQGVKLVTFVTIVIRHHTWNACHQDSENIAHQWWFSCSNSVSVSVSVFAFSFAFVSEFVQLTP